MPRLESTVPRLLSHAKLFTVRLLRLDDTKKKKRISCDVQNRAAVEFKRASEIVWNSISKSDIYKYPRKFILM